MLIYPSIATSTTTDRIYHVTMHPIHTHSTPTTTGLTMSFTCCPHGHTLTTMHSTEAM